MDYDLYESVVKYYKSFCTKTSDLKSFFGKDSSFFFIGESGQTLIAYGKEDIERQIEEQFWSAEVSEFGNTLVAFNINIEKKNLILCPKPMSSDALFEKPYTEVAVIVVGTIKGVHTEDDIRSTKALGRRFVQTFLIQSSFGEVAIKSTFFSYLVPTISLLTGTDKPKPNQSQSDVNSDFGDRQTPEQRSELDDKELDFQKMVENIDKLIDDSNCSATEVSVSLSPTKVESNRHQLMPISVDEVFADNLFDENKQDFIDHMTCEQYIKDIWTQTKTNDIWVKECDNKANKESQSRVECSEETNESEHQNNGTSFADVLRDNIESWQQLKTEDKPDIRIINNCKAKFKTGGDRKFEYCGQQNITIMGAQNLEDFVDHQILFVANIPIGFPKPDFRKLFEAFGKVLSIKFVDRIGVAFAFVYFESNKCVDEVIRSVIGYNNLFLNGLQFKVERYKRRMPSNVTNN